MNLADTEVDPVHRGAGTAVPAPTPAGERAGDLAPVDQRGESSGPPADAAQILGQPHAVFYAQTETGAFEIDAEVQGMVDAFRIESMRFTDRFVVEAKAVPGENLTPPTGDDFVPQGLCGKVEPAAGTGLRRFARRLLPSKLIISDFHQHL